MKVVEDVEDLFLQYTEVAMPDLVTVSDVEICSTGSYKLGKDAINDGLEQTTFTEGDLADAILAVEDPHLHAPRLKLGHVNEQQEQSLPSFWSRREHEAF